MTKWCVVPNCKTGSRTAKKQSVFRVPKDIETWKKWEESIPGNVVLCKTDVVCEKHFNAEDISREWIKLDANGRVIARVAYKYPQLKKLAVPTKFDNDSKSDFLGIGNQYEVSAHSSSQAISPINGISTSSDANCELHNSRKSTTTMRTRQGTQRITPQLMHETTLKNYQRYITLPASIIGMDDELSISPIEISKCEPPAVDSFAEAQKLAEILPSLGNSKLEENAKDDDFSAYVPERWSWVNMFTDIVRHTLFTYAVTKNKDGEDCPVAQKSVTLNVDGTLKYFVYGRHVDPQDKNLVQVLKKKETLPDILGTFRGMNICIGLGDINIHLVPADGAYYDYVDKWRSKDCSLLSKKKRCDVCMKTRKCILQREARLQNRTKIERIGAVVNSIDTQVLLAMRLKIRRERCQKLRAQNRVKLLTTYIKAQEPSIEETAVDEKRAESISAFQTPRFKLSQIGAQRNHCSSKQKRP